MGYSTTYRIQAIDLNPEGNRRPKIYSSLWFNGLGLDGYDKDDEVWSSDGTTIWRGCTICKFILREGEPTKWYDHDDELIKVSKKFKQIVFILDGEGEESGDIWRKFFLNGAIYEWCPTETPPELNDDILQTLRKK